MNPQPDSFRPPPTPAGTHFATLLVSVFLMLLSFFIVLVANSSFDVERSKDVLESVNKSFIARQESIETTVDDDPLPQTAIDRIFDDVLAGIASLVPMQEVDVSTHGNVLVMKLHAHQLFERDSASLREDKAAFYEVLSDFSTRWQDKASLSITMAQGAGEGLELSGKDAILAKRAGNFARFLESQGIPARQIGIAIAEREPDTVSLIFRIVPLPPGNNEGRKSG